jgi:hypothetical protein
MPTAQTLGTKTGARGGHGAPISHVAPIFLLFAVTPMAALSRLSGAACGAILQLSMLIHPRHPRSEPCSPSEPGGSKTGTKISRRKVPNTSPARVGAGTVMTVQTATGTGTEGGKGET